MGNIYAKIFVSVLGNWHEIVGIHFGYQILCQIPYQILCQMLRLGMGIDWKCFRCVDLQPTTKLMTPESSFACELNAASI